MQRTFLLLGLALASCSSSKGATLPEGFDQRSTPETAFLSFQSAVAKQNHDREFEYLSNQMRRRFGVRARTDWKDARAAVLTQDHLAIKGIMRARIGAKPVPLRDGRVKLDVYVRVIAKFDGTVWMRPQPVLRIRVKGDTRDRIYLDLPGLTIAPGPGMLAVMVPDDWQELIKDELSGEDVTMVQAQVEWFVDDFAMGDETADDAAKEVESKRKK